MIRCVPQLLLTSWMVVWTLGCATSPELPPTQKPASENVADPAEKAQLTVRFEGFAQAKSELVSALYANEANFAGNDSPYLSAFLAVEQEETIEWTVEIPPGRYAIKVYQDLDGDRELDRAAFGIPTEPYGFSNNARAAFGPPSFDAAGFTVFEAGAMISIQMRSPQP